MSNVRRTILLKQAKGADPEKKMPHPTSSTGTRTAVFLKFEHTIRTQKAHKAYKRTITLLSAHILHGTRPALILQQCKLSLPYPSSYLLSVSIWPPHCPLRLPTPSPPAPLNCHQLHLHKVKRVYKVKPVQTATASTWHRQGLLIHQTSTANSHHFWSTRCGNK